MRLKQRKCIMSKNQNNPNRLGKVYNFLEKFWLAVAIVSVCLTTYIVVDSGIAEAKFYIILPIIATSIWFMRRRLRESYQKMVDAQEQEQQ